MNRSPSNALFPFVACALAALALAGPDPVSGQRLPTGLDGIEFANGAYLGGARNEFLSAMAHAADGDVVVCGHTLSEGLATPGAAFTDFSGTLEGLVQDVFVARWSVTAQQWSFVTYLGGTAYDTCTDIAVDQSGNIVVVGETYSTDFPVHNAFDGSFAGGDYDAGDGYVTKFSPDLSTVLFSTYVGGFDQENNEILTSVAIGADDSVYVAGWTNAPDFPATLTFDGRACLADEIYSVDAVFAKLNADGSLEYAACFGGPFYSDRLDQVLWSPDGNLILGGRSYSPDLLPSVPAVGSGNLILLSYDENIHGFDGRLQTGASGFASSVKLARMNDGAIVMASATYSDDLPVTPDAIQPLFASHVGLRDLVFVKASASLDAIEFSTYFGSALDEAPAGLAVDDMDQIWFTTTVQEAALPSANAPPIAAPSELGAEMPFESVTANANDIALAMGGCCLDPAWLFFARNGQNYRVIFPTAFAELISQFITPFGPPSGDSRDVAVTSTVEHYIFVDGVAFANYGSANVFHLSGFDDDSFFEFGDADGNTTHIAMIGYLPEVFIYTVDEGGPKRIYSLVAGGVAEVGTFGDPAQQTVALTDCGYELIEAVAPNLLRVYDYNGNFRSEHVLDGVDVEALSCSTWQYTLPDGSSAGDNALLVSNSIGPSEIVRLQPGGDPSVVRTVVDPDLTGINSMAVVHEEDVPPMLLALTDDAVHLYELKSNGDIVKLAEDGTSMAGTRFASATYTHFATRVPTYNPAGPTMLRTVSPSNIYVGALSADGQRLAFGAHTGGDGANVAGDLSISPISGLWIGAQDYGSGFVGVAGENTSLSQAAIVQLAYPLDGDNDTVPDLQDNCTQVANPDQTDTNMDGFGNVCDPDLNDDGMVNFIDLNLLKNAFFSEPGSPTWNADADLTSDGIVNFADLFILKSIFFGAPGPAADPWP